MSETKRLGGRTAPPTFDANTRHRLPRRDASMPPDAASVERQATASPAPLQPPAAAATATPPMRGADSPKSSTRVDAAVSAGVAAASAAYGWLATSLAARGAERTSMFGFSATTVAAIYLLPIACILVARNLVALARFLSGLVREALRVPHFNEVVVGTSVGVVAFEVAVSPDAVGELSAWARAGTSVVFVLIFPLAKVVFSFYKRQ